jgi:uncharacterized membrane protein
LSLQVLSLQILSLQILCVQFPTLRRILQDIIRNTLRSLCTLPVIFVGVRRKLNFLKRFFEKFTNMKFHEKPSSGSRLVPRHGLTDA